VLENQKETSKTRSAPRKWVVATLILFVRHHVIGTLHHLCCFVELQAADVEYFG
jgi:hypothetical protein